MKKQNERKRGGYLRSIRKPMAIWTSPLIKQWALQYNAYIYIYINIIEEIGLIIIAHTPDDEMSYMVDNNR